MSVGRPRLGSTPDFAALLRGSSPKLARLAPGHVVGGRYRLERPLARGAQGDLWIAQHTDLRTEVVLKFLSERLPDEDDDDDDDAQGGPRPDERFRQEAQITAQLAKRSRHIVAVYDAGVDEGTPYLVMEWVRGQTLAEHIEERGPMTPARAAEVVTAIADALATAHAASVLHRDSKPSNVMVAEERRDDGGVALAVRVTDFGVAKSRSTSLRVDRRKETSPSTFIGSPAYASPEQLRGEVLDDSSDLWSFAAVAYELLTGDKPFEGGAGPADIGVVMIATMRGEFTRPGGKRPELQPFDGWFARAFSVAPAQRFASAEEMAAAFAVCAASVASVADHRRSARRGGLVAGAVAMVGALAVALGVASARRPLAPAAAFPADVRAPAEPVPPLQTATAATAASPPPPSASTAEPSASASASARSPRRTRPPARRPPPKRDPSTEM